MAFPPEVASRITDALRQRRMLGSGEGADSPWPCPFCRTSRWQLEDGFVTLIIGQPFQGKALPSIALICQNCGYTMLLNLIALGLGDLVGVIQHPVDTTSRPVATAAR